MYWVWQKLGFVLGGLLFPLEFYPDWLRRIARFSPFPNLCWATGRSAFGFAPREAAGLFAEGLVWAALFALVLFALSRRARARLTVNGG
jgi:ABC-2 type transport system permease protein